MSTAVPVLVALLLAAFAGILLQKHSPAFALLLSLGAAVWLLLRLAQPLRGVLQAMVQLGQEYGVELPICQSVYHILYENGDPHEAIRMLMGRDLKGEFDN